MTPTNEARPAETGEVTIVRDMDPPRGAWDWIEAIAKRAKGPHVRIETPGDAEVIVFWHNERPAAFVLNLRDQFNHSIQYRAAPTPDKPVDIGADAERDAAINGLQPVPGHGDGCGAHDSYDCDCGADAERGALDALFEAITDADDAVFQARETLDQYADDEPHDFTCVAVRDDSQRLNDAWKAVKKARDKLRATPSASVDATIKRAALLEGQAQFLCDRLDDHDFSMSYDDFGRDWYGHVAPALSRLKGTLSAAPTHLNQTLPTTEGKA